MDHMSGLAALGHTIVATLHQPRAAIWALLHQARPRPGLPWERRDSSSACQRCAHRSLPDGRCLAARGEPTAWKPWRTPAERMARAGGGNVCPGAKQAAVLREQRSPLSGSSPCLACAGRERRACGRYACTDSTRALVASRVGGARRWL